MTKADAALRRIDVREARGGSVSRCAPDPILAMAMRQRLSLQKRRQRGCQKCDATLVRQINSLPSGRADPRAACLCDRWLFTETSRPATHASSSCCAVGHASRCISPHWKSIIELCSRCTCLANWRESLHVAALARLLTPGGSSCLMGLRAIRADTAGRAMTCRASVISRRCHVHATS